MIFTNHQKIHSTITMTRPQNSMSAEKEARLQAAITAVRNKEKTASAAIRDFNIPRQTYYDQGCNQTEQTERRVRSGSARWLACSVRLAQWHDPVARARLGRTEPSSKAACARRCSRCGMRHRASLASDWLGSAAAGSRRSVPPCCPCLPVHCWLLIG